MLIFIRCKLNIWITSCHVFKQDFLAKDCLNKKKVRIPIISYIFYVRSASYSDIRKIGGREVTEFYYKF